jgi:hypothetical protein
LAQHYELFRSYPGEEGPGLRVFVPTAEYLLAMKLMAMRIDPAAGTSDLDDILNLINVIGVSTREELRSFAGAFYPEARVSGRLALGIEAVWSARTALEQNHAPRYLGRSRPPA